MRPVCDAPPICFKMRGDRSAARPLGPRSSTAHRRLRLGAVLLGLRGVWEASRRPEARHAQRVPGGWLEAGMRAVHAAAAAAGGEAAHSCP